MTRDQTKVLERLERFLRLNPDYIHSGCLHIEAGGKDTTFEYWSEDDHVNIRRWLKAVGAANPVARGCAAGLLGMECVKAGLTFDDYETLRYEIESEFGGDMHYYVWPVNEEGDDDNESNPFETQDQYADALALLVRKARVLA